MIEAMYIDLNDRSKASRGINNNMTDIRKELERSIDESGTDGDSLTSTEVKGRRLASELDRVRERYKRDNTNWRATINTP